MAQLLEVVAKLTDADREKVQDFAEFLLARNGTDASPPNPPSKAGKISFEGWAGCLAHVDPEKSDKEILREAWDAVIDKHEK